MNKIPHHNSYYVLATFSVVKAQVKQLKQYSDQNVAS